MSHAAQSGGRGATPVLPEMPAADAVRLLGAWLMLLGGGIAVIQSACGRLHIAGNSYVAGPWSFSYLVMALVWSLLCVLGCAEQFSAWRSAQREARGSESEESARATAGLRGLLPAVAPAIGLVAIAAMQQIFGIWHIWQLPVMIALVGLTAGRIAHMRLRQRGAAPTVPRATSPLDWAFVSLVTLSAAAAWTLQQNAALAGGHLGYADVGIFASRLLNTWRWTTPLRDNPYVGVFWDHFDPGLYLLTPLVAVCDPMQLLNAAHALALAAPAWLWFWICRRRGWAPPAATLVALAWLLLPHVSQGSYCLGYGFHPVALALPLVVLSLELLERRRWIPFAVVAVAACLFRETTALSYVGVGLWLIAQRGRRRAGVLTALGFGAYFIAAAYVLIPAFNRGSSYIGPDRFRHLGESLWQILGSPLLQPGVFWGTVLSNESLLYVAFTVACLGLLPLRRGGPRWLALLPEGLFFLMREDPLTKSICTQYQLVLLVLLFWMVIDALGERPATETRASDAVESGEALRRRAAAWSLFVSAAAGCLLLGWWPALRPTSRFDLLPSRADEMRWAAAQVTADDDVAASWRVAAHATRAAAVRITSDLRPEQPPPSVYLLDYGDDWGRLELQTFLPEIYDLHRRALAEGYLPVGHCKAVVALRRAGPSGAAPPPFLDRLPDDFAPSVPRALTDDLTVLGWSLDPPGIGHNSSVVVTLYLRVEHTPPLDYGIRFGLLHDRLPEVWAAGTLLRPAGSFAAFTSEWPAGAVVRETAHLTWVLPAPPRREDLQLLVELSDLRTAGVVAEIALR